MEGCQIFSNISGDLVATIENDSIKMCKGKNAMAPQVKSFYEEIMSDTKPEESEHNIEHEDCEEEVNTHFLNEELNRDHVVFGDAPSVGGTSAPSRENPMQEPSVKALVIWDIPQRELPEFSPVMGVETPSFKEFVERYKLEKDQVIELIRRLERRG